MQGNSTANSTPATFPLPGTCRDQCPTRRTRHPAIRARCDPTLTATPRPTIAAAQRSRNIAAATSTAHARRAAGSGAATATSQPSACDIRWFSLTCHSTQHPAWLGMPRGHHGRHPPHTSPSPPQPPPTAALGLHCECTLTQLAPKLAHQLGHQRQPRRQNPPELRSGLSLSVKP